MPAVNPPVLRQYLLGTADCSRFYRTNGFWSPLTPRARETVKFMSFGTKSRALAYFTRFCQDWPDKYCIYDQKHGKVAVYCKKKKDIRPTDFLEIFKTEEPQ